MLVISCFQTNYGKLSEDGVIAGILMISFLIPVLLFLKFSLTGLLWISPVSLAVAGILQYSRSQSVLPEPAREVVSLNYLVKNRLNRTIVTVLMHLTCSALSYSILNNVSSPYTFPCG